MFFSFEIQDVHEKRNRQENAQHAEQDVHHDRGLDSE